MDENEFTQNLENENLEYESLENTEQNITYRKFKDEAGKKDIIGRINRICGSLNGITKMISEDRYCNEVLIQLSAVEKSIKSVANRIIENHLNTCIIESIKNGNYEIMSEVVELFKRFQ